MSGNPEGPSSCWRQRPTLVPLGFFQRCACGLVRSSYCAIRSQVCDLQKALPAEIVRGSFSLNADFFRPLAILVGKIPDHGCQGLKSP